MRATKRPRISGSEPRMWLPTTHKQNRRMAGHSGPIGGLLAAFRDAKHTIKLAHRATPRADVSWRAKAYRSAKLTDFDKRARFRQSHPTSLLHGRACRFNPQHLLDMVLCAPGSKLEASR